MANPAETSSPLEETIIIGGGISGLATAWFLHRSGRGVRLLEASPAVGGVIRTLDHPPYRHEQGPNSTLQKPGGADDALGRMVASLGLQSRLCEANAAAGKRFVLKGARLQPLPDSPVAFLRTPLFSWRAKLRLLMEPWVRRGREEESIAAFVRRRLGQEFLDYAVEPFVSGVWAGDPERLSVRAAAARIHALEERYGSLLRGALAMGRVAKGAGMPRGRLVSFDTGMGLLPETIAARLPPGSVTCDAEVIALRPQTGGWQLTLKGGELQWGRRVVLALPALAAARLLRDFAPGAADLLEGIAYGPIAILAIGYPRRNVEHPLDGFGFLAPRREGVALLGGLFSSTLFPGRAEAGRVLVTLFAGGRMGEAFLRTEDARLKAHLTGELAGILGISGDPERVHLTRIPRAIPQYELGHLERLAELDRILAPFPGLYTRGNWRDGISVADCIRNGERLATVIGGEKGAGRSDGGEPT
ncbi:MAG: protoporphyrinogen oxidase [Magnetococcales bacterium]|nr:protoporphyrinogen oxidase [Magnetococcales bacterium]